MDKPIRAFIHLSNAWYADTALKGSDYVDEISFGLYYRDKNGESDGAQGEMCFKWYKLDNRRPMSARLECFHDAFEVLASFGDLLHALGKNFPGYNSETYDSTYPQPEDIIALLKECGFKDLTPTDSPYKNEVSDART